MKNKKSNTWLWVILSALVLIILLSSMGFGKRENKYSYSEVIAMFDAGQVKSYTVDLGTGELIFKLKDSDQLEIYNLPNVNLFYDQIQTHVDEYNRNTENEADKISYDMKPIQQIPAWISFLPSLLLLGGMFAIFYFTYKQSKAGGNVTGFGKAKAKLPDTDTKVTFDDVAGEEEEKNELVEVVDFLKHPTKFNSLGARIPKGILLVGPPGTGKTLLAKAVAGEAGVPFFSISGSDFVEMFVGVGASRVRDLFDQAKKSAPAIVFIDEIDAVGRQRGAGLGGGHDEREQTLNQLLVEMDGFGANTGVIVMAATNRRDILDPALLRPGRFDREIYVGAPDVLGREAILRVHARNKPLAPDVDLKSIAATTAGFTGADLENLLNEAALLAARQNLKSITHACVEEATIKVVAGPEKKSKLLTDKDKRLTAFHEGGHAVVTYYCSTADKVHQISIVPRGMAGGYTMSLPVEDKTYRTRREMFENLQTLLGGRIAEQLVLDDISTGASNDIERVTAVARSMVMRYGFSDRLGTVVYGSDPNEVFLGRSLSHERDYSEEVAAEIDEEVRKIIKEAYRIAKNTLSEHMDQLHIVAEALMEKEKLSGEEFESLMTTGKLPEKKEVIAEGKDEEKLPEAETPIENVEEAKEETKAEEEVISETEENKDNQ